MQLLDLGPVDLGEVRVQADWRRWVDRERLLERCLARFQLLQALLQAGGAVPLALADPAIRDEAFEILRGLIERVVVHPSEDGPQVELLGEIVRMVELGLDAKQAALSGEAACSVKVVAGACNHLYRTFMAWTQPYRRGFPAAEQTCQ